MDALRLTEQWPVAHVSAGVIAPDGSVSTIGDGTFEYRLASISKPMTAWAVLVAVEEGTVALDAPPRHVAVQEGCTMRHLLAHAGGYPFDGPEPITGVERTRIYSNTGIELAADEVARASGLAFADYLREAVLVPLGLERTSLRGSPAHQIFSTLDDTLRFVAELRRPTLLAAETARDAFSAQYPALSGIVPGVGRFAPCPWGLGVEIRGDKSPHWTGTTNSPRTFGHFGGSGTMTWVDPEADTALVALTDRPFDEWATDALQRWPEISDAVLAGIRGAAD